MDIVLGMTEVQPQLRENSEHDFGHQAAYRG
jgi:hypothetical protein